MLKHAGVAAFAASLTVVSESKAEGAESQVRVGRVVSKPTTRELNVAFVDGPSATVVADGGTYITRGVSGVRPDLSDFVVGDEVVVEGWSGADGRCVAVAVQSLYRDFRATLQGVRADAQVDTSAGPIALDRRVPGWSQLKDLPPQTPFRAEIWLDPSTRRPIVLTASAS